MVSAVFHSPLEAAAGSSPRPAPPLPRRPPATAGRQPRPRSRPRRAAPRDFRAIWLRVLPPLLGFGAAGR